MRYTASLHLVDFKCASNFGEAQLLQASQANSALYAKLAKPLVAGFYAKLLIPRLGT